MCLCFIPPILEGSAVVRGLGLVSGVLMALVTYRCCRTGAVIADGKGITVRTVWRNRHFPWDQIESLDAHKGSVGLNPLPRVCLVITTRDGGSWRAQDFNSWWRKDQPTYVDGAVARLRQLLAEHRERHQGRDASERAVAT